MCYKPLTIRRARQEDKDAIWRVHIDAIRGLCASHYEEEVIDVWVGRTRPEKYEESIDNCLFLVAEDEGGIVGFGVLNRERAEIGGLYVSSAVAGRGVGRRLLRMLEDDAVEAGLRRLELYASLNAVRFYESAGYVAHESLTHQLRPGVERACVHMVKQFTSPNRAAG